VIEFVIPGQPVPKARPRFNGKTRCAFTPARTRQYERAVAILAKCAGAKPTLEPVHVRIALWFADARRRDLDNCIKTLTDGLNGIAYADDSQIIRLEATKSIDRTHPRAWVQIEEVEQ